MSMCACDPTHKGPPRCDATTSTRHIHIVVVPTCIRSIDAHMCMYVRLCSPAMRAHGRLMSIVASQTCNSGGGSAMLATMRMCACIEL